MLRKFPTIVFLNELCNSVRLFSSFPLLKKCKYQSSKEKNCLSNLQCHDDIVNLPDSEFPYYIDSELRKVYPYYYEHSTFCKGRWINKKLIDIYSNEFPLYPREEYETRILRGNIKVNGETVTLGYTLRHHDLITANVHRHELAVLALPIDILYESDEVLIVNKPPSIPVHPCGLYRYNSILAILSLEHNYKNLYAIHRLDRLTSGVLIFAKTSEKSQALHKLMDSRKIKKEYICRVHGNFPEGIILCNKPIKRFYNKIGVSLVCPEGKLAITEFQKLSYNGKSSVVLCRPLTGRTHQIRVHLRYLGYPIINDPVYNSLAFGPIIDKIGILPESTDQLLADLSEEHINMWALREEGNCTLTELDKYILNLVNTGSHLKPRKEYEKNPKNCFFDENCFFCKKINHDPCQTNFFMCLHALKYESDNWEFKTDMPFWAFEHWNIA